MYRAFYSLSGAPFSKENAKLFASKSAREARARLEYLKKTRGMGLLVGEPGAGKTFTLRCFTQELNPSLFKPVYFPLSTGTVMDFYRGLVRGLGEEPLFRKVDLFEQLQQRTLSLYRDKKITPVFIMDEMHLATQKMLTDIGLLFNFNMDSLNPFVLILAGLPSLMQRLEVVHAQPLNQRIIMRYTMEPLEKEEIRKYIEQSLQAAGACIPLFTEDGLEAVASLSHGWPRVINNLCLNALLLGAQAKKEQIDAETVRLASRETGM
ncbi:MAG TPA: AAA family ATPase [Bacillota bacterium]|jgi:general secretion pathway protein A|nr:AAA family ATPase [Bacillota bacterium]HPU02209.1 AAA family ATPase [Bacillota bacterium]